MSNLMLANLRSKQNALALDGTCFKANAYEGHLLHFFTHILEQIIKLTWFVPL